TALRRDLPALFVGRQPDLQRPRTPPAAARIATHFKCDERRINEPLNSIPALPIQDQDVVATVRQGDERNEDIVQYSLANSLFDSRRFVCDSIGVEPDLYGARAAVLIRTERGLDRTTAA